MTASRDEEARGYAPDVNITTMTCGEPARNSAPAPTPGVPAGLGDVGAALWREVVAAFELRPDELVLLTSFCQVTDECQTLCAVIAEQGLTVTGSRGQLRGHPLLTSLSQVRALQVRLQAQLGLSDEDEDPAKATPASRRAQHAAQARWAGHAKQTRESSRA